jgi:hypothetical protein
MASIDTAAVFDDYARYIVASQEIEPGGGWEYTGIFTALAQNPTMQGDELGRVICDTYLASLNQFSGLPMATLSVVDLTKLGPLLEMYGRLGDEVLVYASQDQQYLGSFSRIAREAESYHNSESSGYSNMIDLGDLVLRGQQEGLFPVYGDEVLSALQECVVYKVSGNKHWEATGLSCFYSYDGRTSSVDSFVSLSSNRGVNYFFEYSSYGELSDEALAYTRLVSTDLIGQAVEPEPLDTRPLENLEGHPLALGTDGQWQLNVGSEAGGQLAAVYVTQAWVEADDSSGLLGLYGLTAHFPHDYANGVFSANFQNDWGALGELPVYMEPMGGDANKMLYTAPVLINGVRYSLIINQDLTDGSFAVLGAMPPIDEQTSMAAKELYQLKDGDRVEAIMYMMLPEGERDVESGTRLVEMPLGEIIYDHRTVFHLRPVSGLSVYEQGLAANFMIMFVMLDYAGNTYYSAPGYYQVLDGVVSTYTPGG